MNFKEIHIGRLIKNRVAEYEIPMSRICNFMKCTEQEITDIYLEKNISTEVLLKWCKLLEYDFFRLYSQHLILYAPAGFKKTGSTNATLPRFRKNIYTKDIISFILKQVESGVMSKSQVINEYKIPKTTLYKWIMKYKEEK
ncbi:transposase [Chryseobacterium contaminans]|uniref:Transposase n=1 Tax=Chryseobacterium contaminans TaxID=1423959 RepID=A0A1M7BF32_9FLAO|nr:transposase [Chryseobacterium contaminans]OCA76665.1 transposase [Chryseobacterium contaminans]SHL53551.1 hypothetical protein SAMN05444407_104349 [Chryseobacterium contaminans]